MRRPIVAAVVIGVAQAAIVCSLAAQAALDRGRLPRAWVRARPVTSTPAAHGRYLRVYLVPVVDAGVAPRIDSINGRAVVRTVPVALEARDGRLLAHKAPASRVSLGYPDDRKEGEAVVWPAVDCFVPAADGNPSRLLEQRELWIEVTVPRQGPPRPIRLGTMKDGSVVAVTDRD